MIAKRTIGMGLALALFLLAFAACGSTKHPSAQVATDQVAIRNFAFNPETIRVTAGTTVTWTNDDSVQHSVESTTGAFSTSPLLLSGSTHASFSHTFTQPGTYPYICGVHNYMTGTVIVTP